MKCPRCWSDKAYRRKVSVWEQFLLGCLFLVPMRCQHCYYKFSMLWFFTLGKVIEPPPLRIAPLTRDSRPSVGARRSMSHLDGRQARSMYRRQKTRRADAA